MKKNYLLLIVILYAQQVFGQHSKGDGFRSPSSIAATLPPSTLREVSGIVKGPANNTVIGAVITLTSKTDTLRTATNADGKFVFKSVKSAIFELNISEIGYVTSIRKYLNSYKAPKIILDTIVLQLQTNMLKEVRISGPPVIIYKTDTVEYKASNYKVHENATVDELLKKMEGMEVGADGSLTQQGQPVTKVRLNGKDYAGGDIAQAIQNLPADIVDKIQIVDDYGDEAARTGVKTGDPQKVLNITTKATTSMGDVARVTAGAGSNSRYDDRLFAQELNANQQIGIIGNLRNTVNGVAGTGINGSNGESFGSQSSGGGSGGTTKSSRASLNYRDDWGEKVSINASYSDYYNNVNSINNSDGQQYTMVENPDGGTSKSTIYNTNYGSGNNIGKTHRLNFDMEYNIDSANYLRIQPSYSYTSSNNSDTSTRSETGFIHQGSYGRTVSNNTSPSYDAIIFYQHLFKKKRRNISLQLSFAHSNAESTSQQKTNILYYKDSVSTLTPFQDSLVDRVIERGSLTKSYRASMTYVEPLTLRSQLEFNAQATYRGYNNNAGTDNIVGSLSIPVDSLSNIYQYSFTLGRVALNYRLNQKRYNLSLGITAIPTLLQGSRVGFGAAVNHSAFNLIPIIRYEYAWSRLERISVYYTGTPTEPTFNELQPFTDLSNPQNPVTGNPNLKQSFTNAVHLKYNYYIANSQMNFSTNVNAYFINNQVVANNILQPVVLTNTQNNITRLDTSYITNTHYANLNGSYAITGNYNIAKQFDDRKYNLELNGNVSYGYNVALTNNIENFSTIWHYSERFGPRINPSDLFEINPYISYDVTKSTNTLSNYNAGTKTVALSVDGRIYFLKTWMFGYSASKEFVSGISSNITKNPFVVNATIGKEFFKKRNGILSVQFFDLLDQNNFVNRVITPTGYTDVKSNALSRYVMVSFRLNLQKWNGAPRRYGKLRKRRGDGSFLK